jgi:hypothetical protein
MSDVSVCRFGRIPNGCRVIVDVEWQQMAARCGNPTDMDSKAVFVVLGAKLFAFLYHLSLFHRHQTIIVHI